MFGSAFRYLVLLDATHYVSSMNRLIVDDIDGGADCIGMSLINNRVSAKTTVQPTSIQQLKWIWIAQGVRPFAVSGLQLIMRCYGGVMAAVCVLQQGVQKVQVMCYCIELLMQFWVLWVCLTLGRSFWTRILNGKGQHHQFSSKKLSWETQRGQ